MRLPAGATAVIIGGGVIGASVAWHLTRLGVRDVLVLDREPVPGAGSTGRATGGYRATFATEPNIRLSLLARETLRRFHELCGVSEPVYQPVGYLWIARAEATLALLRAAHALQRRCGLDEAEIIPPDDVYRLNPAVGRDPAIRGALWCPTDGYVRPLELLAGYRAAAEREGARFEYGVAVNGVLLESGRVVAVQTGDGLVGCDFVVNAAGPWAALVAGLAGVELPVTPVRRQAALTVPTAALPPDMPMTLWADDGFHVRSRDGRALYAWPDEGDADDPWGTSSTPEWVAEAERTAHERLPVLRGVAVDRDRCWAGLYEVSPDRRPILGAAPGCANFLLANGASGHGVMHSAAIGRLVAELATGTPPSLDPAPFAPERFVTGGVGDGELL